MKRETIKKIAEENKLINSQLFVEFIARRFPDEIKPYVMEWAERFKSGDPTVYMDAVSFGIFQVIIKEMRK